MSIGIVVVCTNAYFILGLRFIKKFNYYYKGSEKIIFYLFTDTNPSEYFLDIKNINYFQSNHLSWRDGTNSKFKNILQLEKELCDYYFYFDADTDINKEFTEDWFMGDLVGGEHYNNSYTDCDGKLLDKPFDRNPNSKAYIPKDTSLPQMYYYGAFFGGRKDLIMNFCKINYDNQQEDMLIKYEPVWNDESYINHYFHYNPPTHIVLRSEFNFLISDKGGLSNMRDVSLNIEHYKEKIKEFPSNIFTIQNGSLIFHF